jgi:hypothetical protein
MGKPRGKDSRGQAPDEDFLLAAFPFVPAYFLAADFFLLAAFFFAADFFFAAFFLAADFFLAGLAASSSTHFPSL